MAKLEVLKKNITARMDTYDLNCAREIPVFIDELSTWYVRRSRDRFKGEDGEDKMKALKTLRYVLFDLSKLMAPFMPFMAEYVYKELNGEKESVHLEDWPAVKKELVDKQVLDDMDLVRKIVEFGLAKRAETGIKVRQPLGKLKVKSLEVKKLEVEFINLIKDEINVKEVIFDKDEAGKLKVELDTEITEELRQEGMLRELVRTINQMRKKMGLTISDKVAVRYSFDNEKTIDVFVRFSDEFKKMVLAEKFERVDEELEIIKVNEMEIGLKVDKL